jgi:hypothetical protein
MIGRDINNGASELDCLPDLDKTRNDNILQRAAAGGCARRSEAGELRW